MRVLEECGDADCPNFGVGLTMLWGHRVDQSNAMMIAGIIIGVAGIALTVALAVNIYRSRNKN
jgi:hypothetical protein